MSKQYRYIDNSGNYAVGICITPDGWDDGRGCIELDGGDIAFLPVSERQAAAQALAGDEWRVVGLDRYRRITSDRERLGQENDDLRKKLADAGAVAAQPDRPEPVDPGSVPRETGPPSPKMLREAANILETAPYEWVNTAAWLRDVAHTLEEPDPEQVRAWTQWLVDHGAGSNGVAETLARAGLEVPSDG